MDRGKKKVIASIDERSTPGLQVSFDSSSSSRPRTMEQVSALLGPALNRAIPNLFSRLRAFRRTKNATNDLAQENFAFEKDNDLIALAESGNIRACIALLDRQIKNVALGSEKLSEDGVSPVHRWAAHKNLSFSAKALHNIFQEYGVDARTPELCTPLMAAARFDNREAILKLLQNGAGLYKRDRLGRSALHYAATTGEGVDGLRELLRQYDEMAGEEGINQKDFLGISPLHRAASLGNRLAVRMLVTAGADKLSQELTGKTALHLALSSGNDSALKILHVLVGSAEKKSNIFINQEDQYGRAPFFSLCELPQEKLELKKKLVDAMLKRGADRFVRDGGGKTILFYAIASGDLEFSRYLIENGLEVDGTILHGAVTLTLLHAMIAGLFTDAPFKKDKGVQFLLENGADVSYCDSLGRNNLCYAAGSGNMGLVQTLLQHGASFSLEHDSLSAVSADGVPISPVICAGLVGNSEIVARLIKYGKAQTPQGKKLSKKKCSQSLERYKKVYRDLGLDEYLLDSDEL